MSATVPTTAATLSDGSSTTGASEAAAVSVGAAEPVTTIFAFIHGWGVQSSGYVPGLSIWSTADLLWRRFPVSNAPVVEVAVCPIRPWFVTTIFWPASTVSVEGA